jgi:hypothetical protein
MNKKGQLGDVITWFPAFVIIFFILGAFFVLSFIIASGKIFDEKEDLKYSSSFLESESNKDKIFIFLESEVYKGYNGRDLIYEYYFGNDLPRENVTKFVGEYFGSKYCYYFSSGGELGGFQVYRQASLDSSGGQFDVKGVVNPVHESVGHVYLYKEGKKIRLSLRTEEC